MSDTIKTSGFKNNVGVLKKVSGLGLRFVNYKFIHSSREQTVDASL